MCLEIYDLDPEIFFCAPELAWQTALKRTKVKLYLLTDIDMLIAVEKGTRWGICHYLYRYAKGNDKCMKDFDKNNEFLY